MKKQTKTLVLFLMLSIPALAFAKPPFYDVVENHPSYRALTKYYQRGIFKGIDDRAGLDDGILKSHATMFLLKVLDAPPTLEEGIKRGIISTAPDPKQYITHAEYVKMISTAFNVPVDMPTKPGEAPQPWFVKPFIIAQSITAVRDEKPFDFATRGFVLRSTEIYERLFGTKDAAAIMDEQELRLMKVRDFLVDPTADNQNIQKLIWMNILEAEEVPDSMRLRAIKYFNQASLVLLELRRTPAIDMKNVWTGRLKVFLDKAVEHLPESQPFAEDFKKIGVSSD